LAWGGTERRRGEMAGLGFAQACARAEPERRARERGGR
jgi:hypothetical protein